MNYTKKRIHIELSDRQLDFLEKTAKRYNESLNETMKDFFYIYLQERMLHDEDEYTIIPIYEQGV